MNPEYKHHSLLEDVLAEAVPADFGRVLLDGTLRAVRCRRQVRQWSRRLAVVGVFTAIALTIWNTLLPTTPVRSGLHVVSSRPFPPSMIVETQPGGVTLVTSSPNTFLPVRTGAIEDPFQEINDEQLLALAGDRPVVLVREGPHQAELLFLNPEDKNGFLVQ